MRNAADRCSWCGHRHELNLPCKGEIQVGAGKRGRVMRPCPCRRHVFEQQKKEVSSHG